MNWINKIFKPKETTQKNYISQLSAFVSQETSYSNFDLINGIIYACIDKRANAVAKYEQKILKNNTEIENHWILDLLENNPYASWTSIKSLIEKWLCINGNAYLWTKTERNNLEIWLLPSDKVRIKVEGNRLIGFDVTIQGLPAFIPYNEICHIKTLAPSGKYQTSIYEGIPDLLNAAQNLIISEIERQKYFQRQLKKDNTAPYVIEMPDEPNPEYWTRWREQFNSVVPKEFKAIAVLDGGKTLKPLASAGLSANTVMLDSESVLKQLTGIFGVPIGLITNDFSNRATAEVVKAEFYSNTIEPRIQLINDELTKHFKQFENDIVIYSDYLQYSDPEFNLKENQFLLDYGIVNRNDIREMYGYDRLNGFDTYNDSKYQSIANNSNMDVIDGNKDDIAKHADYDNGYLNLYWKTYDNAMTKFSNNIEFEVKKVFRKLKNEIVNNNKSIDLVAGITLFDVEKYKQMIINATSPDVKKLLIYMVSKVIKELGEGVLSDFETFIQNETKLSTAKISESINTINKDLKLQIQSLVDANPAISKQELLSLFMTKTNHLFDDVYTVSRAKMIATTTTTFSTASAQKKVFSKYNYKYKWLSQRDGNVRDTHKKADGNEPDENGLFRVGRDLMLHPGAGNIAEENVNCRCILIAKKKN